MLTTVRMLLTTASLLTTAAASADLVVFTPDQLADFQVNGAIVAQVDGGVASSTVADPTVENPNVLTVSNTITQIGQVSYVHELTGATFSPVLSGAITGIRFSIEVRDPGDSSNDTPIHFGIRQDDRLYFYTENGSNRFSFRNADSETFLAFDKVGLGASDFGFFAGGSVTSLDGADNPDFSLSGDPLRFVYVTASGTSGSNSTRTTDFRNSLIEVSFTAVPEASPLLVMSLLSVFSFARHHRVR